MVMPARRYDASDQVLLASLHTSRSLIWRGRRKEISGCRLWAAVLRACCFAVAHRSGCDSLQGDVAQCRRFEETEIGGLCQFPGLMCRAWVLIGADRAQTEQTGLFRRAAVEELDNSNELNLIGFDVKPVAASAAPHRSNDSCIAKHKENLRQVVLGNTRFPGKLIATHHAVWLLSSQVCQRPQGVLRGSGKHHGVPHRSRLATDLSTIAVSSRRWAARLLGRPGSDVK